MSLPIFKCRLKKGIVTAQFACRSISARQLVSEAGGAVPPEIERIGQELKTTIHARFGRSLHIRQVDTGSCSACESEIIACTNPLYDIQRFGIDFVASPRHADALLVTGPVPLNMAGALKKTYEAMPEPKFVIAVGACTLQGGVFRDSYYACAGVESVVPVAVFIPGCPPHPVAIMRALCEFLALTTPR